MRVLLVEDDAANAQSMALMLKSEGMRVYTTDLGEDAIDLAQAYDFDVALLDWCLPDISGGQVLTAWREKGVLTPALVVTGTERARDDAFALGAAGFQLKPFHKDELMLGIFGAVREACGFTSPLRIGTLRIDLVARKARMGKAPLFLTRDEFRALELLALRRGATVDVRDLNDG
jgi:two-component system cell cycle response regulator CtrA